MTLSASCCSRFRGVRRGRWSRRRRAPSRGNATCFGRSGVPWQARPTPFALPSPRGHGVGKSALVAWIIVWALATFRDTRGVVTANTAAQLKTKTWPELTKWLRLAVCANWFEITATAIASVEPAHERTWRIDAVPWNLRSTEAFAGLHNQGRRLFVAFDEASAIPDLVWETIEGALTDRDTEILWLATGNPHAQHRPFPRMLRPLPASLAAPPGRRPKGLADRQGRDRALGRRLWRRQRFLPRPCEGRVSERGRPAVHRRARRWKRLPGVRPRAICASRW